MPHTGECGPLTPEWLRQAIALTERAAAMDRIQADWAYPYFQFAKGLAEYRQGRFDQAISVMRGDASRVPGPAPRLVLAMAMHRTGQVAEARKTLAAAVLSFDWRANQTRDHDDWIRHVLRREAESMILPNLPAFLDDKYRPRDNPASTPMPSPPPRTWRRTLLRDTATTPPAPPPWPAAAAARMRPASGKRRESHGAIRRGNGCGRTWPPGARRWTSPPRPAIG